MRVSRDVDVPASVANKGDVATCVVAASSALAVVATLAVSRASHWNPSKIKPN